jgi:hypothetical protein
MAKQFTYTNTKTGKVIFESTEPNFVSIEDVDKKVLKETGNDPRLNPHLIERQIRVVDD